MPLLFATWVAWWPPSPVSRFQLSREETTTRVVDAQFAQ